MSKVESVKVEQKFRTGEYEHIIVTVAAAPDLNEDPAQVVAHLLRLTETREGAVPGERAEGRGDTTATDKPARTAKPEQTRTEKPKETAKTAEPKKEEQKEAKPKKVKLTPFDKEIDIHKKKVNEFMDVAFPEKLKNGKIAWKNDPLVQFAREVSAEMAGQPCMDGEGNIAQEFKDAFIEKYREKVAAAEAESESEGV